MAARLFLDEIGDMPLSIQAKFLRVLQEGEIEALGSNTVKKIDVRIIAATSQDLEAKIADRTFRADLYYRVAVLTEHVPPLRERHRRYRADLRDDCWRTFARAEDMRGWIIEPEAVSLLGPYDWPGNVRELRNVLERAAAIAPSEVLDEDVIARALPAAGRQVARGLSRCRGGRLAQTRARAEREAILDALRPGRWQQIAGCPVAGRVAQPVLRKAQALRFQRLMCPVFRIIVR